MSICRMGRCRMSLPSLIFHFIFLLFFFFIFFLSVIGNIQFCVQDISGTIKESELIFGLQIGDELLHNNFVSFIFIHIETF